MSAYTQINTRLVSRDHLVAALREMGFEQIEVHESPVELVGVAGERSGARAEVVIRRRQVGVLSNDIGFQRDAQGFYRALISDYDRKQQFDARWLARLNQRYACAVSREQLKKQGFDLVEEQVDENDTVRLVLRRAV